MAPHVLPKVRHLNPKLGSIAVHGAVVLSFTLVSIAVPLLVLTMSHDRVVRDNAKESLNFHLNLYGYGAVLALIVAIAGRLSAHLIGLPLLFLATALLGLLGVATVVMPLLALVACAGDERHVHHYPFVVRVLD
jgi:uncharacterized protein